MPLQESRGKPPYKHYGGDTESTPTCPAVYSWQSRLSGKDPDTGKDQGQKEKVVTEGKVLGWHHQHNGHETEKIPGDKEGQGSLAYCSPWDRQESDITQQLNETTTNLQSRNRDTDIENKLMDTKGKAGGGMNFEDWN